MRQTLSALGLSAAVQLLIYGSSAAATAYLPAARYLRLFTAGHLQPLPPRIAAGHSNRVVTKKTHDGCLPARNSYSFLWLVFARPVT